MNKLIKGVKVTERARRDFEFLAISTLDSIGVHGTERDPRDDPAGFSALECWFAKDTHGATLPCREIELLHKVERAKASWNLQIKEWAGDIADGLLLKREELKEYCRSLPPWIFEATMRQAQKLLRSRIGFVPTFATNYPATTTTISTQ